ncbi:hypothetical protein JD844_015012 [Phrynosoma platyrhinos]|uniref:RRM domain-containing protein n=1 Tax=Phrynosoma platyrhinos TaxID=52577 RepID=A0ABQ7T6X4_PHRPL|nr:hypothetical protein JD844_015012 [Phrynosoma platyrhinos]
MGGRLLALSLLQKLAIEGIGCSELGAFSSHCHSVDLSTPAEIDPKVAFPRRAQPKMVTRTKKIFVGGLSVNTTVEDVKQYFEQFGKDNLKSTMLFCSQASPASEAAWLENYLGATRFGFVTFESEDIVEKVCEIHFHEINNKMVECKKAQPKEVMSPTGSARGRSRVMPYGMDAFMLGIGMLGYPGFQAATYASRSYTGIAPGYTYQFPAQATALKIPVAGLIRSVCVCCCVFPSERSKDGKLEDPATT